jgi:hypothetical protein
MTQAPPAPGSSSLDANEGVRYSLRRATNLDLQLPAGQLVQLLSMIAPPFTSPGTSLPPALVRFLKELHMERAAMQLQQAIGIEDGCPPDADRSA